MELVALLPIIKEVGAFIAFLFVILVIGQKLINSLITNITNEMRSGFTSICERLDSFIGSRSVDTQVILAALNQHTDVIVGHIVDRPICPLHKELKDD